ncbi:hypothetical protein EXIGLDRAFT_606755, partial [Exidia glandulosa HHB12029]
MSTNSSRLVASTPSAGLTEKDREVLRAFAFKTEHHIPRRAFKELPRYFRGVPSSTHDANRARARALAGLKPVKYDCCINTCVLFVGPHAHLDKCPHCDAARRDERGRPFKEFVYAPVIPRLRAMYRNPAAASQQRYRHEAAAEHEEGCVRDYTDGSHYRDLCQKFVRLDGLQRTYRYFSNELDVALGLCTDGFAPFRKRKQTC